VIANSEFLVNITEYKFPFSTKRASEILAMANIFCLGNSETVKFRLVSDNDNFLHGGGRVLGLKEEEDAMEGDDKGQTFGLSFDSIFEFEQGQISVKYFSELYSKSVEQILPDGTSSYQNPNDNKFYTKNAVRDSISIKIHKELEGDYYAIVGLAFAHSSDTGLGLHIQETFHDLTNGLGNRAYSVIETGLNKNVVVGKLGIGKRYTILKNKTSEITSEFEIGYNPSNSDYLRTFFVNTALKIVHGRSTFKFEARKDSRSFEKYGLSWGHNFYSGDGIRFGTYTGIYKQQNEFTKDYFDYGHEGDMIYEYGLEFEAKF
jgi:hypothetical protein